MRGCIRRDRPLTRLRFAKPPSPTGERVIKSYIPPILQTIFHSSGVTGCTESLEYFTSAMPASFLSALIANSPWTSAERSSQNHSL